MSTAHESPFADFPQCKSNNNKLLIIIQIGWIWIENQASSLGGESAFRYLSIARIPFYGFSSVEIGWMWDRNGPKGRLAGVILRSRGILTICFIAPRKPENSSELCLPWQIVGGWQRPPEPALLPLWFLSVRERYNFRGGASAPPFSHLEEIPIAMGSDSNPA